MSLSWRNLSRKCGSSSTSGSPYVSRIRNALVSFGISCLEIGSGSISRARCEAESLWGFPNVSHFPANMDRNRVSHGPIHFNISWGGERHLAEAPVAGVRGRGVQGTKRRLTEGNTVVCTVHLRRYYVRVVYRQQSLLYKRRRTVEETSRNGTELKLNKWKLMGVMDSRDLLGQLVFNAILIN